MSTTLPPEPPPAFEFVAVVFVLLSTEWLLQALRTSAVTASRQAVPVVLSARSRGTQTPSTQPLAEATGFSAPCSSLLNTNEVRVLSPVALIE